MEHCFHLKKRISRTDTGSKRSACWSVVEIPSLLVLKGQEGGWVLLVDRLWMLGGEKEAPLHVRLSAQIENHFKKQSFPTRNEALIHVQAFQLFRASISKDTRTASRASRRVGNT